MRLDKYYTLLLCKILNFLITSLMWMQCWYVVCHQCDPIWWNFAALWKSFQVFGKFLTVYFLFDKMLSTLWQFCVIIGHIFIAANGQILKNNLTIGSHCLSPNVICITTSQGNITMLFLFYLGSSITSMYLHPSGPYCTWNLTSANSK